MASLHQPIWALSLEEVYESLITAANGLAQDEATERLEQQMNCLNLCSVHYGYVLLTN